MKPANAKQTEHPTKPVPQKLALAKETLRRLAPAELRLTAGGFRSCGCYI